MTSKVGREEPDFELLLVLTAVIVGSGIRFFIAYQAGFPINDGGLFFNIARAIQDNGYLPPIFVSYNGLEVPFAYPPLGFYIANLFQGLFGIPLLEVFRWLPALVTSVSIYAVYLLAGQLLDTKIEAGVAAMVYALLPRSITWLIMGGGITRSLGQLFLILTAYNVFRLFSAGQRKFEWCAIITSSLVCLTHPEATLHTIWIAILIWFFKGRNKATALQAIRIALGTLLFTAFWWLPTIMHYGIAPFSSAAQTGLHDPLFFLYFFIIPFSDEPHLTLIIVFAIIGLVVAIAQRKYLLPLFYLLPFVIEPRNAANVSAIPMAMLASLAFNRLVLPGITSPENFSYVSQPTDSFHRRIAVLFSIYLFTAMFIGMLHFSVQLADKRVTDGNLQAFEWIKLNTPPGSRFLVLTGKTDLFGDWTTEWFPSLAQRISVTTIQGREWTDAQDFGTHTEQYQNLQQCIFADQAKACMDSVSQATFVKYEYIYIAKKTMRSEKRTQGIELAVDLKADLSYTLVYETNEVAIFHSE